MQNSYGHGDLSGNNQAVALKISGDRCAFYNCKFLGFQDTVLDDLGRHYFKNCYIEGGVDFICGNGKSMYEVKQIQIITSTVLFHSPLLDKYSCKLPFCLFVCLWQSCELHAVPVFYGVFTAQKRMGLHEDTGFVFLNCKLTGNGTNYLGKPWGPYSTVVFANTYMEKIIKPEGWEDWDNDFYKQK